MFLIIEDCNYIDYPVGGQLSFAIQLLNTYGNQLGLVGISTDSTPVGKWVKKEINGVVYDYFAYIKILPTAKKPIIPFRLATYFALKKYKYQILSKNIVDVIVRGQHTLKAISNWEWNSICYYFPGVENPLSISRYAWAKKFARVFDFWFLPALKNVDVILAAADLTSIMRLRIRGGVNLDNVSIVSFPTHVDMNIFFPSDKIKMREIFNLSKRKKILVTTGRIHWAKGWKFLIDAFYLFLQREPNSLFIFVGDGEDRIFLEKEITKKNIQDKVIITGFKEQDLVAKYIQCADVFVMGSLKEGWSTSLIEALACAKPIVSTQVSSADTIIRNNKNGFIVKQNDIMGFVTGIEKALLLKNVLEYSVNEIEKYSLKNLSKHLGNLWKQAKIKH